MAAYAKAEVAPSTAALREHVDRAAFLLEEAGNVYRLADLLASTAYAALCHGSDRDASELIARAIPITRELENPYLWMMVRGNFGLAAVLTGDIDAARDAFREELALCRELTVLPFACEGLVGLAAVATVREELHRAARLYGAADAHRYGQPQDPVDARLYTTFFDAARERLGADVWDARVREGAALSFEDAIAYGLQDSDAQLPVEARR
jgi:ATP/maltotriose-dependent transcriptional regulator MalT